MLLLSALIVAGQLLAANAAADDGPYCRKVRAHAAADAALLWSPSAVVQGIKFPDTRTTDGGITVGSGYQLRAGLGLGPLDVYKGTRLTAAADSECEAHAARQKLVDALASTASAARVVALRKAVIYLDENEPERRRLRAATDERLAAQAITVIEAAEVNKRVSAIARRRAQLEADLRAVERTARKAPEAPLGALAADVEAKTMDHERRLSHIRSLDAWSVQLLGGVVPQAPALDWFGMVTVGVNFGTFMRTKNEQRYLEARRDELRDSPDGPGDRARELARALADARRAAREELAASDEEATRLHESRAAMERAGSTAAAHMLALLGLEQQLVEVERLLLRSTAEELERIETGARH